MHYVVDQPLDFRVSRTGAISTSRRLSFSAQDQVELVVYARDQQSREMWKTKVHLQVKQLDERDTVAQR